MKKEIIFIHSAGPQGTHEGSDDLIHYLRESLGSGYKLYHPAMPDPENPRYQQWKMTLQSALPVGGNKIAIVGHSLGGSVIVKYLSEGLLQVPVAGLFLVSTPWWGVRGWTVDEFQFERNFEAKLPPVDHTYIYHSRNDNWVPYSHAGIYHKKLPAAVLRSIDGDQHEFNLGLPELVNDIKALSF
jgi:predicted alpha/beta hydrolase family esterase